MGRSRTVWSNRDGRWRYVVCLLLAPLALVLIWTSVAPALSPPALDSQLEPTFSSGADHTLALRSDGSLWAWGGNKHGQLGDGTDSDRWDTPTRIWLETDWAAVTAGYDYSLALKSDGSLWAWGVNSYGQLGDGTGEHHIPTRIGTESGWISVDTCRYKAYKLVGGAGTVVAVPLGFHTLALKSDGSLWAWGSNVAGQVGDGTTTERHVPTRVGADDDWVAISAGCAYCLALKEDGSLWAWGLNGFGQLGDGTATERHTPVRVGTDNDWSAVSAGSLSSLALKSDGSLWAWGRNKDGQVGDGTTNDRLVPTRVGTGTDWCAIRAGNSCSQGVKSDGSLWRWGYLGFSDTSVFRLLIPTRVGPQSDWAAVAAGLTEVLALREDGSLWSWGPDSPEHPSASTPNQVFTGVGLPAPAPTTTSTTTSSTTTTLAPGLAFSDVPASHPYYAAIMSMASEGIVEGYEDGTFGPDRLVLRKHFAKMIVGAMGLGVGEDDWQDSDPPFLDCGPDDPNSVYPHDYIAVGKAHGLTSGKTAVTFAPDANITRAQMVTMVVRAAQNSGIGLQAVGADYGGLFEDYTDPTHGENVHLADYNGLLLGLVTSNSASSWMAENATRGEVAQVLWNLMQMGTDQS